MQYGQTHLRQTDVLSEHQLQTPITIIGVGGIGSHTAYLLARMGFNNLTLIDPDTIEPHNIGGQIYTPEHINRPKVEALAAMIERDTGTTPQTRLESFVSHDSNAQIVVSGVDSMSARKEIWEAIKANPGLTTRYIEGRMTIQRIRLYSVNPYDEQQARLYEATLYDDSEATPEPCNAQQIMFTCYQIASLIGSNVVATLNGQANWWELNADTFTAQIGARTI